jgi:hypothetical protein
VKYLSELSIAKIIGSIFEFGDESDLKAPQLIYKNP